MPIKIDGTVEYDIMSDFPAWPNLFSMLNSGIGAVLPTYLLRGIDTSNLTPQLVGRFRRPSRGQPTSTSRWPSISI